MAALLPRFVEMQVYHAVLESVASEQSARMVAMRNATDNANDMVSDLTLEMNKARQSRSRPSCWTSWVARRRSKHKIRNIEKRASRIS